MSSGVAYFPQVLPPSTVIGRLASGSGPAEAIPISDLTQLIQAAQVTSTTSNAIAASGSLSFTIPAGEPFVPGQFAVASSSASPTNYVYGIVASYAGTTLVIAILGDGGSGTFAAWNIAVAGAPGVQGPAGPVGAQGVPGSTGSSGLSFAAPQQGAA